jgi:hypothetical protein
LEQNYEHYHIPQKPVYNSAPPVQHDNLQFSSPQKLPFEKEKERARPAMPPSPPQPKTGPLLAEKPFVPERPQVPINTHPLRLDETSRLIEARPQPLHITPATPYDEEREELPRNVVNLREV